MNIKSTLTGAFNGLQQSILGARRMPEGLQRNFRSCVLAKNILLARRSLWVLFLAQAANFMIHLFFVSGAQTNWLFIAGAGCFMLLCAVYMPLIGLTRENKPGAGCLRSPVTVKSCCLLLSICAFVLTAEALLLHQSLTAFIMTSLILALLPVLSFCEAFLLLTAHTALALIISAKLGIAAALVWQICIVSVFSLCISQQRYRYHLQSFINNQTFSTASEKLERLAETDPLTRLLNRRGLEQKLCTLEGMQRRADENLCVLMLDIDFFKHYNDKYFHQAGDDCLVAIARCLERTARRCTDIIARYGGEEFVLVLQNMERQELLDFALQIKRAVHALGIPFGCRGFEYITVSVGLARLQAEESECFSRAHVMKLLHAADEQLYQAKDRQRNCVSFEGEIYC
ncbi:MAG: GGDEF domain-containing protein [Christensenellales bacterium]|jgi:diguanylate cyclase (GGDEF)-like protein